MAAPATKSAVTVTSKPISAIPGEYMMTEGGILQVRGSQATYEITLNIYAESPLVGTSTNVLDGRVNTKTGEAVFHYDVIWTFEDGSFEGVMQSRLESYPQPYEYYEIHCVLKGEGEFEGQTLKLTYEGTTMNPVWTGFIIRPQ